MENYDHWFRILDRRPRKMRKRQFTWEVMLEAWRILIGNIMGFGSMV